MSRETQITDDPARSILRVLVWAVAPTLLLLVPLIAMQITDEVQWDVADFTLAAVMLITAGGIYGLVSQGTRKAKYRTAIGLIILMAVLWVWVELAVGIFH